MKKIYAMIVTSFFLFLLYPLSASAAEERLITFKGIEIVTEEMGTFFDEVSYTRLNSETVLATFESKEQLKKYEPIIQQSPFVQYVEHNVVRVIDENAMQPVLLSNQTQWWKSQIDAKNLDSFKQKAEHPVQIAVIDSGVDPYHESLQQVLSPHSYDFTAQSYEMVDYLGHGTAIAGIIAANNNNPYQITGTAEGFPVYILSLRVMDDQGRTKVSQIVEAIDYAVAQGVQVINLSFGGNIPVWSEKRAIEKAREAGVIVVASAGNTAMLGNPVNYPANYEGVIAVGATNQQMERARFSNYHPYVSFVAPGTSILTTVPNNGYKSLNGTSFATPMVSSTLAMLLSIEPSLTEESLIQLLKESAIDLSDKGRDDEVGFGLIQVKAALEATKNLPRWNITPLQRAVSLDEPIPASIEMINDNEYGLLLEEGSHYFTGMLPYFSHSSDPTVATIDSLGYIRAHRYGQTKITIYTNESDNISFQIKVAKDTRNKVALFSDKDVKWKSDYLPVASVDPYGIVTFNRSGYVTIHAHYEGQVQSAQLVAYSSREAQEGPLPTSLGRFSTDQTIKLLFNELVAKTGQSSITLSFDERGDLPFNDFTVVYRGKELLLQPNTQWPLTPLYLHLDGVTSEKGASLESSSTGYFTFYSPLEEK